jgi:hypothetical protein
MAIFRQLRLGQGDLRGFRTTHRISGVTRLSAALLLFIATLGPPNLALCERHPKVEKVTGRILAYSSLPACLNGNVYWAMLIRVQDRRTGLPSEFVQVQFSLPCAQKPDWLDRRPSVQKFRLTRQQDADSVLKEFSDCAPGSTDKCAPEFPDKCVKCLPLRIWKPVPGAEEEKFPFGHRVPSYRSVYPPLSPLV